MSMKQYKEIDAGKVEMDIVIAKDVFEAAVNKVFLKNKNRITVPGFRKGKAPRGLIEQFYGKSVFYEDAVNDLLPSEIESAVKETPFRIAGMPEVTDVNFDGEDGVGAKVTFVRYPDVTVKAYKGLKVDKVKVAVEDSELENELESVRRRYARTIEVTDRAAQNDDTVTIDYLGTVDGVPFDGGKAEGHKLKLGSGSFIPGFEEQVVGKKIGDEFDVNVTFPKEYHAEELAGKDAVFACKLHAIEYEELPTLDDEFAKDASEFDTLDAYKADLKAKIEKRHDEEAENRMLGELNKALCDNTDVTIPDVMIDREKENLLREYDYQLRSQGLSLDIIMQYTGMKLEDIRERYADQAKANVIRQLALEEVVKAEKIEATDADIDARYDEMAKQFGMKVEDVKGRIAREDLAEDIKIGKAFDLVKDAAKVTEKVVSSAEFAEMNAPKAEGKAEEEKKEEKPKKTRKAPAKKADDAEAAKEEKPAKAKKTADKADDAAEKPAKAKKTADKADDAAEKGAKAPRKRAPKTDKE